MTKPQRLLLIDWLRTSVMVAITFFHCNEFIFFTDIVPGAARSPLTDLAVRIIAWPQTLGGQVLVAITYLLFGLSGKTRNSLLYISAFALLGQLVLTISFNDTTDILGNLEWDIYFYIAATNILLLFLPRASWALTGIMAILLAVTPDFWQEIIPAGFVGDILTGRNLSGPQGGWALLPWFFFAVLFFNFGALIRSGKLPLSNWQKNETFLWPVLLGISLPFFGAYYGTPLGPNYYDWHFHRASWVFWANFLPFVLVMRVAFLTNVQDRFNRHRPSRLIGNLMWNRNLGACYITSVLLIGIGAQYEEVFLAHPLYFDLFFLSVMPVTEIIVRILMLARKQLPPRGGSSAR